MITYRNILIAVDGSHEAKWVLNRAVDVAKHNDAKLIIVNVTDSRTYSPYKVYDVQFIEKSKHFVEGLLDGCREVVTNAGVRDVGTRPKFGSSKFIIPKKLAHKVNADLIMNGTSGSNTVERFVTDSIPKSIARHVSCDVLVVRAEELPANFQPQVVTTQLCERYQNRM